MRWWLRAGIGELGTRAGKRPFFIESAEKVCPSWERLVSQAGISYPDRDRPGSLGSPNMTGFAENGHAGPQKRPQTGNILDVAYQDGLNMSNASDVIKRNVLYK